MKKTLLTLCLFFCIACLAGGALLVSADGETDSDSNMSLLLPYSFEQYLQLNNPSDIALTEQYMAIADGKDILLYNRQGGTEFFRYSNSSTVSSLNFYQFGDKTYLYFISNDGLQGSPILYIECAATGFVGQAVRTSVSSCASFVINTTENGTMLYCATASIGYVAVVSMPMEGTDISSVTTTLTQGNINVVPAFDVYNSSVYYSWNNSVLTEGAPVWTAAYSIFSFALTDTDCFYAAPDGCLYKAAAIGNVPASSPVQAGGTDISGVETIQCYQNTLYLVIGNAIRGFDPVTARFNGYEISRYSSGENRLGAGAQDLSVYDNLLAVADTSNTRVLLYNTGSRTYRAIPVAAAPRLVCAGENTFAVADDYTVYIYSYDGALIDSAEIGGEIFDLSYSFGNYYLVSNESTRKSVLSPNEDGTQYSRQSAASTTTQTYLSVSNDIGGYVYVLADDGSVWAFSSEANFLTDAGTRVCDFPGATQLLSDFAGNLYGLDTEGSSVWRYSRPTQTTESSTLRYDFSLDGLVSGANTMPVAIGFGYQSNIAYLLSDGFIAKTDEFGIASLDTLPAEGLYDTIYHQSPDETFASGRLARVPAGAVTVEVNLASLENRTTLDCSDYERETQERIGVVLAQTDYGAIVVFYTEYTYSEPGSDQEIHVVREYDVRLILDSNLADNVGNFELLSDDETLHAARTDSGDPFTVGYTTNTVGLYKYPLMGMRDGSESASPFGLLTGLAKSTQLELLHEFYLSTDVLDNESYYFVRLTDADGHKTYGFVSSQYVLPYRTEGAIESTYVLRHVRTGRSITLYTAAGAPCVLSNEAIVRAYGDPDADGKIYVTYTDSDGVLYSGMVDEYLLYKANETIVYALVFVPIVTIAVLLSICYLIFRKQPTLQ